MLTSEQKYECLKNPKHCPYCDSEDLAELLFEKGEEGVSLSTNSML